MDREVYLTRARQSDLGGALAGGTVNVVNDAAGCVVDTLIADEQAGLGKQFERWGSDSHVA